MNKVVRHFLILDDRIFGLFLLFAFPFSIFVVSLDHETCSSCFPGYPLRQQIRIVLSLVAMSLMIAYLTHLLYNIFIRITKKPDAFVSALILGFIANLILIFVGLLLLWPILLPATIVMMVISWLHHRRELRPGRQADQATTDRQAG